MTSTGRMGHFEYVVVDGEIDVYDIDREHRFVQRIDVPEIRSPPGVVAHPDAALLYISNGGR